MESAELQHKINTGWKGICAPQALELEQTCNHQGSLEGSFPGRIKWHHPRGAHHRATCAFQHHFWPVAGTQHPWPDKSGHCPALRSCSSSAPRLQVGFFAQETLAVEFYIVSMGTLSKQMLVRRCLQKEGNQTSCTGDSSIVIVSKAAESTNSYCGGRKAESGVVLLSTGKHFDILKHKSAAQPTSSAIPHQPEEPVAETV